MPFPISMAYWLRSRVTEASRQETAEGERKLYLERTKLQYIVGNIHNIVFDCDISYCTHSAWRSLGCGAWPSAGQAAAAPWTQSGRHGAARNHSCPAEEHKTHYREEFSAPTPKRYFTIHINCGDGWSLGCEHQSFDLPEKQQSSFTHQYVLVWSSLAHEDCLHIQVQYGTLKTK